MRSVSSELCEDQLRCSQNIDSCWNTGTEVIICVFWHRVCLQHASCQKTLSQTGPPQERIYYEGFQTHQRPPADRRLQGFYQQMMLVCFLTDLLHEPAAPIPMRGGESGGLNWTRKEFWRNTQVQLIYYCFNKWKKKQMKHFCEIHPEVSNFAVKI